MGQCSGACHADDRFIRLETTVEMDHRTLFGNGQPGEIAHLKNRITDLEKWMWRVAGGGAVCVMIFERVWK